ncbi:chloramphenicol acetyltransferase [Merismopedia glauca CCAP 1448/3]|uniref:Chloramphenicol acetyltransferase n=1 Tax=Merismopedia glauca CCAP 1448/3 TaxID=1296344 RepID=A0A2T1C1E7_9CYAN|nr:chloramphenicol acetyltransferase [Merismopedia glauca CCAP 1448/3]
MNESPNPDEAYPLEHHQKMCFLKNIVTNPNIIVGDFTYYDDLESAENFEKNVLYHFDFIGDKLIIGKFCAIASDVKFIMNGGNHLLDRFTTYPFPIFGKFGQGWGQFMPESWPHRGDTIIGNDVWIGYDSLILPGVKIGDGAVIGAKSVVTKDVAPYTIVAGNPAKLIKRRFNDEVTSILLQLKWWDWEIQKINENLPIIFGNDLQALSQLLN